MIFAQIEERKANMSSECEVLIGFISTIAYDDWNTGMSAMSVN